MEDPMSGYDRWRTEPPQWWTDSENHIAYCDTHGLDPDIYTVDMWIGDIERRIAENLADHYDD